MTILQPSKNFVTRNLALLALALALALIGFAYVYFYNRAVSLRHEIERQTAAGFKAQLLNSDLKNNLYGLTDSESLEKLAGERGLILDKKPKYLTDNHPWAVASQF